MAIERLRRAAAVLLLGLFGCGTPEPPPNPALKVPDVAPSGKGSKDAVLKGPKKGRS